jgi:hypothetical protein
MVGVISLQKQYMFALPPFYIPAVMAAPMTVAVIVFAADMVSSIRAPPPDE